MRLILVIFISSSGLINLFQSWVPIGSHFNIYSAPTIPIPIQLASAELWKNKKHVSDNRKLYKQKVKYADKVFKDYHLYTSPEAGFFLWFKVKDGEKFAKKLYSKYAIKVMPGEYLAYGKLPHDGNHGGMKDHEPVKKQFHNDLGSLD